MSHDSLARLLGLLLVAVLAAGCEESPTSSVAPDAAPPAASGVTLQASTTGVPVVVLPTLGGEWAEGADINERGHVTGSSRTSAGEIHAFLWSERDGIRDLGTLGSNYSDGAAINGRGQVAGLSRTADWMSHAFLWTPGSGLQDLGSLGSYGMVNGLNDREHVVGYRHMPSGEDHAFRWTRRGGMEDLGTLGGGFSNAFDVNDRGQVVGFSLADYYLRAFLWTERDGIVDLGAPETGFSWAAGINGRGEVVGRGVHALLWSREGEIRDLGTLGTGLRSRADDVNDRGDVVGSSELTPDGEWHAFVWTEENGLVDLGTLPGASSSEAVAINNRGQIVGTSGGRAVVWEPDLRR